MAASVRQVDQDGFTTLTGFTWPDAFAGVNQQPHKFAFENNGTRVLGTSPGPAPNGLQVEIDAVGSNDGFTELRIATDTVTLSPPFGLTAILASATGGAFGATGTYGYKVTAFNGNGETIGSFEATFNVGAVANQVLLTWTTIPGATGYKVYRTPTPGSYGAATLLATLGSTGTFTDAGAATTTGTPPSVNQSGSWLLSAVLAGAGGVWSGTGNKFWTLVAFDSTGVVISVSTEAVFNVTDTTKKVTLSWANVPAAASYTLYRSTTSGSYPSPSIVTTLTAGTTTFTDSGAATTVGANTFLNSFGIPPTLTNTLPITVFSGNLAIGQQFFFWVNRVVPSGTPESGNPRTALITIKEF